MQLKFIDPIFFLLLISIVIFDSCTNKGCTDEQAINYSVVANKDDKSCEYCDSISAKVAETTLYLADNNSSSPYYQQAVAKFTLSQNSLTFNDITCGSQKCYINVIVENLTPQDFDLNYNLQGFGNIFFSVANTVSVPANQIYNVGAIPDSLVNNPCGFFSTGSFSVNANSNIIYH